MLDSTGRTFQMDVHTLLLILLLFFVNSIEDEEVDFYTHVKRQWRIIAASKFELKWIVGAIIANNRVRNYKSAMHMLISTHSELFVPYVSWILSISNICILDDDDDDEPARTTTNEKQQITMYKHSTNRIKKGKAKN